MNIFCILRGELHQTLTLAHEIAQRVHDKVESDFPEVKHCMVHVNPSDNAAT